MISNDIANLINKKLNGLIGYLCLVGLIFFVLAAATIIYPQIVTIIFVIAFFVCSFSAFLIAVKISSIKDIANNILKPKQ